VFGWREGQAIDADTANHSDIEEALIDDNDDNFWNEADVSYVHKEDAAQGVDDQVCHTLDKLDISKCSYLCVHIQQQLVQPQSEPLQARQDPHSVTSDQNNNAHNESPMPRQQLVTVSNFPCRNRSVRFVDAPEDLGTQQTFEHPPAPVASSSHQSSAESSQTTPAPTQKAAPSRSNAKNRTKEATMGLDNPLWGPIAHTTTTLRCSTRSTGSGKGDNRAT